MTSGGYTFEEWCRMHNVQPGAPGPVDDAETLRALLDVAAILLEDERPGATFSLAEIVDTIRKDLLDDGQTVDEAHVLPLLPGASFLQVEGGYRWRP